MIKVNVIPVCKNKTQIITIITQSSSFNPSYIVFVDYVSRSSSAAYFSKMCQWETKLDPNITKYIHISHQNLRHRSWSMEHQSWWKLASTWLTGNSMKPRKHFFYNQSFFFLQSHIQFLITEFGEPSKCRHVLRALHQCWDTFYRLKRNTLCKLHAVI
jgi:hypothetical protein